MALMASEETLQLGDKAPDFKLKGIDGKTYNLGSFMDAKALLVIFMCNHCPYLTFKIEEIKRLQAKYKSKGLVIVGINSNDSVNYPDDSFENMVKTAKEKSFNFYYLHDESQQIAKAYGAVCTPDPFLFDSKMKLAYHGRLDDALNPDAVAAKKEMDEIIAAFLEGKKMDFTFRPSQGCSIKWRE